MLAGFGLCSARALADTDPIDATFGTGGAVDVPFTTRASTTDALADSAGRIVTFGSPSNTSIEVARYNPDGTPDASFGTDGVVTFASATFVAAYSAALEPDDSVVVVGTTYPSDHNLVLVARLTPSGVLDSHFGNGGVTTVDSGHTQVAESVAIGPDGRLLVVGQDRPSFDHSSPLAIRLLADGTVDPTFGASGQATYVQPEAWSLASRVALGPNGGYLIGGATSSSYMPLVLAIASNGSQDQGFGQGGRFTTGDSTGGSVIGVAAYGDGTLFAADTSGRLFHLSATGQLLGNVGHVPFQPWPANDAQLLPDGRAVIFATVDWSSQVGYTELDAMVSRVMPDFSVDTSFGDGGLVDLDNGTFDQGIGGVVQADGKPVLAMLDSEQITLVRLNADNGSTPPWPQPKPTTSTTTTTAPPPPPPPAPPSRNGYWMVDTGGAVYAFGDAGFHGSASTGGQPAVDIEATPTGSGYWVVDSSGHVFSFGDAPYQGGTPTLRAGETVTSLSRTPSGHGYWLFTSLGRALPFGDAPFLGDMSAVHLNGPVLDSVPTPTGRGYYMVASDGGVFTFGDARFHGSMGSTRLNAPVQSLVPTSDGLGYWLVASDGGIFAFQAGFYGSMGSVRLNKPVTGMVGSSAGRGYLMVGEDGGIFAFGDVAFRGSLGSQPPSRPITAAATLPA